ncbi:MAG TPA: hypothetical protein VMU50_21880 [Polyangia bacterium]|nr:hypothetical protein [Polyangia bacterium]
MSNPAARALGSRVIAGALCALALVALTRAALSRSLGLRATWPPEADMLYLPGAGALRLASLGHTALAADLVAARANVYFGTQLATKGEQRWLERYLTTAIELDPSFHSLYRRGAAMLVYTGKQFSVEALEAADRILERGARRFPDDWEIWFQLGFNQFFELPPLAGENDPRAPEWRQRGVEALRRATLLDGVPPWLPSLVAQMLTKRGGDALAVKHLEQTYAVTSNEQTREEIRRQLATLRAGTAADELARAAAELRATIDSAYPYAPEAFSIIAGPRRQAGVDLGTLISSATSNATAKTPDHAAAP